MDPLWIMAIILLLAVLGAAAWIRASLARAIQAHRNDEALALLQNQINANTAQTAHQVESLRTTVQQVFGVLNQSSESTRKSLDERLDGAARVIHDVSKQLGQLEASTRQMVELGKDISGLQAILRSPKLRGGLGELLLEDLLGQILPHDHFQIQHAFQGGEKVDAVIRFKTGLVSVDAKFPLENFQRVVKAANDEDRKTAKKQFLRDVRTHIDAIAAKYIRPDEGTFDFALMYVPAENVYYETIVKDDEFGAESSLFNYALKKRVIPVSPNSFYGYLQTILLGLKGMRIEESAREMLDHLARLNVEFANFSEAFRLVGKHLENSTKQFSEADKRLGKLENKMNALDGMTRGLEPPRT